LPEQPPGILLFHGEQDTGRLPDLGQGQLDPPDLTLVLQSIFTNELELLVQTGLLKRPPWSGVNLKKERK